MPHRRKTFKFFGRHFEERGDFVDESTRAARATSVHAHIARDEPAVIIVKEDDFRVLTTKFHRRSSTRIERAHCTCIRHDFLHIMRADSVGNRFSA